MSWIPALIPTIVALALLFIPGLVVLSFAGFHTRLVGTAPAISVGIIGGSAVVWGGIGAPWGISSVAIVTLVAAAAVAFVRWRRPVLPFAWNPATKRGILALAGAIVFGVLVFWHMFVRVVPGPDAIGQLQDTMFHIDVVRFILERADGSSLHTGYMDGSANASGFYPAGWHDVTALVVAITGTTIPIAATAMTAALTVFVFPVAIVTLAVVVFGPSTRRILTTAIAAQLVGAFPWRFLSWGQLYSNLQAMALLPALIALMVVAVGEWSTLDRRRRALLVLATAAALAGVALSQPNTVFALLIFGTFFLLNVTAAQRAKRGIRWVAGATAIILAGFAMVWTALYIAPFMQRTVTWVWPSFETIPQAFGEAALLGFNGGAGQPLLAALVVVGAWLAWRRHPGARWLVASLVCFAGLYILAAGSNGRVRDFLTGFWYHDSYRLAALTAMVAVTLVGYAAAAILGVLWARFDGRAARLAVIAALFVVASVALVAPGAHQQREWIRSSYATDDAWMLSPGERAFLNDVADALPRNAVVLNNPYDGSGLAYGLNGIDVVFPAMDGNWLGTWGDAKATLARSFNQGFTPAICGALTQTGAEYFLQLDDRPYSAAGEGPEWSGLRVDTGAAGFEPLLVEGERGLYRVVGCK